MQRNWIWELPVEMMHLSHLRVLCADDNRLEKLPDEVARPLICHIATQ